MKKNRNKNRKINIYKVKSTKCAEVEKCIRLGVCSLLIYFSYYTILTDLGYK